MPPYDPLYRAPLGCQPPSPHRHRSYTPVETGYRLQENAHQPPVTAERPGLYEPARLFYEDTSRDYEPFDPWSEPVLGSTPLVSPAAPVAEDVRSPKYDDALMGDWLMARAMDGIAGSTGPLDEILTREDATSPRLCDLELDHLAARLDPLAPEAFRRLCNLPLDDLDEDQLFSAAAMLKLFAPPGAFGPESGSLF